MRVRRGAVAPVLVPPTDTASAETAAPGFTPPAPRPLSPRAALARAVVQGRRDLLNLLPRAAYHDRVAPLGVTRRGIVLVNDPDLIRSVMADHVWEFPKNDLFVGALAPLVGNGVFISHGETWRRQRRMIEPGFSHMQVGRAFGPMTQAVAAFEQRWDGLAVHGSVVDIDSEFSHLTADVICRALFSTTLDGGAARGIFDDFAVFQDSVANVRLSRLLWGRPFAPITQPTGAEAACTRIRAHVEAMLAAHQMEAKRGSPPTDLVGDLIAARDPETGARFSGTDLVDQIAVFFLAGHETTASTVAWALFLMSQHPPTLARVRAEIRETLGDAPITMEGTKRLSFLRAVIRETLRLYPPGPFLPRVATGSTRIGGMGLRRGTMVMVSPWLIHRHRALWRDPDRFDPDRFLADPAGGGGEPGSYLPFGLGPRTCVGAAFATVEASLILASVLRRYEVRPVAPETVRPVAKLTIRPAQAITARVTALAA